MKILAVGDIIGNKKTIIKNKKRKKYRFYYSKW